MLTSLKINKARSHVNSLDYIPTNAENIEFLLETPQFKTHILNLIHQAKERIYITALYWEKDEAGQEILDALYQAKVARPELDIKVLVDWHRAQRGRIGEKEAGNNADWYYETRRKYGFDKESGIPFYGVPINGREIFGVLHLKGFVFDDTLLYSGASINNVYLQQFDRYRCDRYHQIKNQTLTNAIVDFTNQQILSHSAVNRLDVAERVTTAEIRSQIKAFRKHLSQQSYAFNGTAQQDELGLSLLVGLKRRKNQLNKTIEALFCLVEEKLTICTPYFNFPITLRNRIAWLLKAGKQIEIIVGDKTANDFYTKPEEKFSLASALPYLYEKNLRAFCKRHQRYIDNGQLIVRLWKDYENTYHLKGVWIDHQYLLLTGNNLNPRAWRLDAENAVLVSDPNAQLKEKAEQELNKIREHTQILKQHTDLEIDQDYPQDVRKVLKRFGRVKLDKVIKLLL
ncbi:CDP-diacylglycerol--serine O-phosphatidyltransferase [Phocoenobacter uteri]|uniref:CDP-diacylglycerol--serine O-phosphatidyltransferase n=1 Tax=Phocoenobacter uteri TaxID=146806 RepID=A0A379C6Y7_9PAST|nr:CDP-diacylglycerol--serine O-phosphatidyltransferase [Phocoenobacter uteri]MDG6881993.1 phosphatidylserine synthase [Phocoenobacter uteri]SUB58142.1 CDP-diacylglycerol--serine O-phosphatidyltransferase [Phocoenobacter uteri]